MRTRILFMVLAAFTLAACHKTKTSDPGSGLFKARTWSGYHQRYHYGIMFDPANYYYTITDSVFSVSKLDQDKISMPLTAIPLMFRSTDAAAHVMKYDSVNTYVMRDSLVYYYTGDSVVFYYYSLTMGLHGMDDPYAETISLRSYK